MTDTPRGPTTEELRARALAALAVPHEPQMPFSARGGHYQGRGARPPALLLSRPCLACNREPGERMCDLCTRLEIAEANAE